MPAIALGTGNTIIHIMTLKLIHKMKPDNNKCHEKSKTSNGIEWLGWGWFLIRNGEGSLHRSNTEGATTMKQRG